MSEEAPEETPDTPDAPRPSWEQERVDFDEMLVALYNEFQSYKPRLAHYLAQGLPEEDYAPIMRHGYALETAWKTLTAIEPFRDELRTRISQGDYRNRARSR